MVCSLSIALVSGKAVLRERVLATLGRRDVVFPTQGSFLIVTIRLGEGICERQ